MYLSEVYDQKGDQGHNWLIYNTGRNVSPNFNFMLRVEALFDLPCKRIHSFTKMNEYEHIQEGGLNDYVHMRRKPNSQPFTFQVERYVGVDYLDPLQPGTDLILPIVLMVWRMQMNKNFTPFRIYIFTGCTVMGKEYGELNAEQSGLLTETTTIGYREMIRMTMPDGMFEGSAFDFEVVQDAKGNYSLKTTGKNSMARHPVNDSDRADARLWMGSNPTKKDDNDKEVAMKLDEYIETTDGRKIYYKKSATPAPTDSARATQVLWDGFSGGKGSTTVKRAIIPQKDKPDQNGNITREDGRLWMGSSPSQKVDDKDVKIELDKGFITSSNGRKIYHKISAKTNKAKGMTKILWEGIKDGKASTKNTRAIIPAKDKPDQEGKIQREDGRLFMFGQDDVESKTLDNGRKINNAKSAKIPAKDADRATAVEWKFQDPGPADKKNPEATKNLRAKSPANNADRAEVGEWKMTNDKSTANLKAKSPADNATHATAEEWKMTKDKSTKNLKAITPKDDAKRAKAEEWKMTKDKSTKNLKAITPKDDATHAKAEEWKMTEDKSTKNLKAVTPKDDGNRAEAAQWQMTEEKSTQNLRAKIPADNSKRPEKVLWEGAKEGQPPKTLRALMIDTLRQ